jgi:hypothetical protein
MYIKDVRGITTDVTIFDVDEATKTAMVHSYASWGYNTVVSNVAEGVDLCSIDLKALKSEARAEAKAFRRDNKFRELYPKVKRTKVKHLTNKQLIKQLCNDDE